MKRQHAIVMGGSIAGLFAARVLSDSFEQVTIVERDTFPEGPEQRRGVPQGRHTHGLLASGSNTLEKFFPGISSALVSRGALKGDVAGDVRWFFEGGCLSRPAGLLSGLLLTRPMLETAVRERILALRNVRRRDNTAVEGLALSPDSSTVTGVQLDGEVLAADLTVDATGRGSRTPQWLETMGYQKPQEESVHMALAYTTRFFRRLSSDLGGDLGAVIPPTPEGKMGGVMIAQEGDRWTVTLISHFGAPPPEPLDGFIDYACRLPAPYIYETLRRAEPLGDAASMRFPASVRRRYEAVARFPKGYLVTGDALCSFNPIYGQGMSVAALEAIELEKALAGNTGDLARRFFTQAAKVVDIPWSIAVGNDLRIPETVGPRSTSVRVINWYISRLHKAAHTDPACALAFHKVGNLLAPPPSIMHPRIALRVLWRNLVGVPSAERMSHESAAAGLRM